jgi:hypothetical protein
VYKKLSLILHKIDVQAAISIVISLFALYFSYQSNLRQEEKLIVSGGTFNFEIGVNPLEMTQRFEISNISESIISLKNLNFDLRHGERQIHQRSEVKVGNDIVSPDEELNLIVRPGDVLTVIVKFNPSVGPKAAAFLSSYDSKSNYLKLKQLCTEQGIDLYDNPLSDAERTICPTNQVIRTSAGEGTANSTDMFMLKLRTHRENSFASSMYSVRMGGSPL